MENFQIKVSGMMCSGCKSEVEKRFSAVDGVILVDADNNTGQVNINSTHPIDLEKFEKALEGSHYVVNRDGKINKLKKKFFL